MGHTNSTPNLHLPQFIGSDKPTWLSDVNGAMLAIDQAYGQAESDAASAVTAANGAVTTANGAASTASSAASTASTAASNASTALTTANNAANTANTAYNEAHTALGRVNGEVVATVTADGVKTYAELLEELVNASTIGSLTHASKIVSDSAGYKVVYPLVQLSNAEAGFSYLQVRTSDIIQNTMIIKPGVSTAFNSAKIESGSVTFSSLASTPAASGTIMTLYK